MFNWLRKLRKKRPEARVVGEDREAGIRKYQLLENVEIQTRRAQNLDPTYAAAIRSVCETSPSILLCFVLDMRRQDQPTQMFLQIELVVKEPGALDQIAAQFGTTLKQFPDGQRTFIALASAETIETMTGAAFFQRV